MDATIKTAFNVSQLGNENEKCAGRANIIMIYYRGSLFSLIDSIYDVQFYLTADFFYYSIYDQSSTAASSQLSMSVGQPPVSSTPLSMSGGIPLSALPPNLSPCPSFNSLNHSYFNSVLPPKTTTTDDDSQRFVGYRKIVD